MTDAEQALALIEESEFQNGEAWEKAHAIAQAHEGEAVFDAIHALLHRIEGDVGNAAYWDRRARTDFGGQGPEAELAAIRDFASRT